MCIRDRSRTAIPNDSPQYGQAALAGGISASHLAQGIGVFSVLAANARGAASVSEIWATETPHCVQRITANAFSRPPVSYTHLDVYKRQEQLC